MIYINKEAAIAAGATHEGTLFGVPAWFIGDEDDGPVMAVPKFTPFELWCWLADKAFGLAAYFTPSDKILVSPINIKRRIAP